VRLSWLKLEVFSLMSFVIGRSYARDEQVNAGLTFPNPRSGWKHKAWGGAERNPRMTKVKKTERAKRAIALELQFTHDHWLSPTSWAFQCNPTILGFRSATPQALCCRRASRAQGFSQTCSDVSEVYATNSPEANHAIDSWCLSI